MDLDDAERVGLGSGPPPELIVVQLLELEDRALSQMGEPSPAIVISSAGADSSGLGTVSWGRAR
jgi:hypothetical protein